jgi:hypothetical protein
LNFKENNSKQEKQIKNRTAVVRSRGGRKWGTNPLIGMKFQQSEMNTHNTAFPMYSTSTAILHSKPRN